MTTHHYISILAGGHGERFWPYSRIHKPKHLLAIVGKQCMLQQTLDRIAHCAPSTHISVVTQKDQTRAIMQACPKLRAAQIIEEPIGRDTAAAAVLASAWAASKDDSATIALLPADHVIHDINGFKKTLIHAMHFADQHKDRIVILGINPTHPSTGYGYIQRAERLSTSIDEFPVYAAAQFVEKPPLTQAQKYFENGQYLWNAGLFVWNVQALQSALKEHAPVYHSLFVSIKEGLRAHQSLDALLESHYPGLEKISIDYALMEKISNAVVIPVAFDWDDVGQWGAIVHHEGSDSQGNLIHGQAICEDAHGNILIGSEDHLTAIVGINDCIVVETPDATLVCPKNRSQEVKKIIAQLQLNETLHKYLE